MSEPATCPACGRSPLRELRITDYDLGESQIGHSESECDECGWNSQFPAPIPCPGCGADLRHRGAITRTATKDGGFVSRDEKQLLGDGSRCGIRGTLGLDGYDLVTDTCAACGRELSSEEWD